MNSFYACERYNGTWTSATESHDADEVELLDLIRIINVLAGVAGWTFNDLDLKA